MWTSFPHSDKVSKIKKKNPIPHWDEPLKAFHKKKMKDRETDCYVISELSAESRARCRVLHITGKCTGLRVSLVWPPLPRLSFIQSKSVWVQPRNMGNPSTNLFDPEDQRLEPVHPRLRWVFLPLAACGFGIEFDVHPCTHHFSFPLIFPMGAYLLSTLSCWNWCVKAVAGFIYNKVPFLTKKNLAKY